MKLTRFQRLPANFWNTSRGVVLVVTGLFAFWVDAAVAGNTPQVKKLIADDLLQDIKAVLSIYLIPIVFSLILLVFLWGLVKFVWGASSDEQAKGKSFMVWGVVALFVAASVWGIVYLLASLFGVDPNKKTEKNPTTKTTLGIK